MSEAATYAHAPAEQTALILPPTGHPLPRWRDGQGRTFDEVLRQRDLTVEDYILSLVVSANAAERMRTLSEILKARVQHEPIWDDRCERVFTLGELVKHFGRSERRMKPLRQEDGPNAGLHRVEDFRCATDDEIEAWRIGRFGWTARL